MAIDQGARSLGFWGWLVHTGLIGGDPVAYETGLFPTTGSTVPESQYQFAIQTAIRNLANASDPRVAPTFYEWLREMGAYQGDPNAYASGVHSTGRRVSSGEYANFVNVVGSHLRATAGPSTPTAPAPTPPGPAPAPTQPPTPALPTPGPVTPEPVDFHARARALFPWLPTQLLDQFAETWAASGDPQLALAEVRASDEYEQFFPGIKRDDGSTRMTEQEWFSTREAYSRLFQDFGLNAQLFENRFKELMEGEVSPTELAGRLGGAYEMIHRNIPEVASEFGEFFGAEGEAALFASFIDPDIGQQILDHRISVAQVAGQGLARGFDVNQGFAERLVAGGVDQNVARNLFIQAEGQLQTLDDLVKRHRDSDDTFDLEEFAEANVFGDAVQTRRIRRVLRAEASLFTGGELGQTALSEDFALTGLAPR